MNEFQAILDSKVQTAVVPAKEFRPHSKDRVIIGGVPTLISPAAVKDCIAITGLNGTSLDGLNDKIGKGAGMAIMQSVFSAMAKQDKKLVIAAKDGQIIRVVPEAQRKAAIPAPQFVELMEQLIVRNPHLGVDSVSVNESGTKAAINICSERPIEATIPDEDFRLGRTIEWDMLGGVTIAEYVHRLICTNGMTGWQRGADLGQLTRNDATSKWFKELFTEMDTTAFAERYMNRIANVQEQRLSLREYTRLSDLLRNNYLADENRWGVMGETSWLRAYDGHDLEEFNAAQMANLETPVNAWEALNVITDLASHQYNSRPADWERNTHRKTAGKMFGSEFDSAKWAPSWAPSFN